MCSEPFAGPAFVVDGAIRYPGMRRWTSTRLLICRPCLTAAYDIEADRCLSFAAQERGRVRWHRIPGRGELLPPTPCAACGVEVIRRSDPLLKRVTCSRACSTSLTRIRNGNKGTGQPCEVCQAPIATGRADSRTCSPACRQKAYRQRKSSAAPPVAEPLTDARGRRMPQRSVKASLEKAVPHLGGLADGFATIEALDASISPEQAAEWHAELGDGIAVIDGLNRKLKSIAKQNPHA